MREDKPPNLQFEQLIGSATHLRFPTGAFGKTCMLIAIFTFSCAAIAWSARDPWVSALALMIVAIVTGGTLWRLFNFAENNPSAAILEGAEFIRHEQIRLSAKGHGELPAQELILTQEPEALSSPDQDPGDKLPDPEEANADQEDSFNAG